MTQERTCKDCGLTKPFSEFYERTNYGVGARTGELLHKWACKGCDNAARKNRPSKTQVRNAPQKTRHKEVSLRREKKQRKDPRYRHKFIVRSCRSTDRKCGRENDLEYDWVRDFILLGCCYCGDTEAKMTLDRVDNLLGHVKTNVVPACLRCNYLRRDMPMTAWMHIVPAVRQARESGLFGGWHGGNTSLESKPNRVGTCLESSVCLLA